MYERDESSLDRLEFNELDEISLSFKDVVIETDENELEEEEEDDDERVDNSSEYFCGFNSNLNVEIAHKIST